MPPVRRPRKPAAALLLAAAGTLVLGLTVAWPASADHRISRHDIRRHTDRHAMDAATLASSTARRILVQRGWRGRRQVAPAVVPAPAPRSRRPP